MNLPFTKMNGAGNDFVVLDNRDLTCTLSTGQIASLCDRHRGIGADGLLAVEPAQQGADFRFRYYNADGGEAEMCGNGARCFGRYARRLLGNEASSLSFETVVGQLEAHFDGELVEIAMSEPTDLQQEIALGISGLGRVDVLNTGVPHVVVFVDELDAVDVVGLGRAVREHPHFAPTGTNVNFAEIRGPGHLAIRTYERGVEGETLACGTGMAACALIYALREKVASPVEVTVRGGDTLQIGFQQSGTQEAPSFSKVTLKGPADFVFEGQITL